ncbi:hypothetical protein [Microbacterium sp.]|uniref:hypothetical protein n=1 Tax=Microbacterium sp. TaxID=51671 RepID=UPI0039E6C13B
MNSTLYPSTTRPPDTEDREVLRLPAPAERDALSVADRLSLRVGLWLLMRAARSAERNAARRQPQPSGMRRLPRRDGNGNGINIALLTYDLHRQLR